MTKKDFFSCLTNENRYFRQIKLHLTFIGGNLKQILSLNNMKKIHKPTGDYPTFYQPTFYPPINETLKEFRKNLSFKKSANN